METRLDRSSALTQYNEASQAVTEGRLSDLSLDMTELEERLEMAAAPDCCCFCNEGGCNQGCKEEIQ